MNYDELLRLAAAPSKGKRPLFFDNPEAERVLGITMAVAQELAVTRERLDTLERILKKRDLLGDDEIDTFEPDHDAAAERSRWQQAYLSRVLRVVIQEIEAMRRGDDGAATVDELAR